MVSPKCTVLFHYLAVFLFPQQTTPCDAHLDERDANCTILHHTFDVRTHSPDKLYGGTEEGGEGEGGGGGGGEGAEGEGGRG